MNTALVTGGAGFIGSHIVDRLLQAGWNVRILDNFISGSWENLLHPGDVEVISGDICDLSACQQACRGVDSVFHLAAISSVASSIDHPLATHDVNIGGTLNMLIAAQDQGVRRFVFSSSASIYGNAEVLPTHEDLPLMPQSPYATSKACGELYCRNFWSLFGLETVVLRYFNVFGPRQNPRSGYAAVIPRFVDAALSGLTPTVYGDGGQTRDFVYVANVASANLRAALAVDAAGGAFNIACGHEISLLDLVTSLSDIIQRDLAPSFEPARPGEVRYSRADISRARTTLGYEPDVFLPEGLGRTIEHARYQKSVLEGASGERIGSTSGLEAVTASYSQKPVRPENERRRLCPS